MSNSYSNGLTFISGIFDQQHNEFVNNAIGQSNKNLSRNEKTSFAPIALILGEKHKTVSRLNELFIESINSNNDVFGVFGATLIYSYYSGTAYKYEAVHSMIETYISSTKSFYDPLIQWSKIMYKTKISSILEPVMNLLNTTLNEWLTERIVYYNGVMYKLSQFSPLLYTCSGESLEILLPYVCYICTFLIHCRPYTFNEATTESSTNNFYKRLEAHYANRFNLLLEEHNIDLYNADLSDLSETDLNYVKDMIKDILHPDTIIKLRNEELSRSIELLQENIADQSAITLQFVKQAWDTTLTDLLETCVECNPISKWYNITPSINLDTSPNFQNLFMWVEYVLGGQSEFSLNDGNHLISDMNTLLGFHNFIGHEAEKPFMLKHARINSKINVLNNCIHTPFASSDLILEMCIAYVRHQFEKNQTNVLDSPIRPDPSQSEPVQNELKELFINGLWMCQMTNITNSIKTLNSTQRNYISNLFNLYDVCKICYKDYFRAICTSILVPSYLDDWLTLSISNLESFNPYIYLNTISLPNERDGTSVEDIIRNRAEKIMESILSFVFIHTTTFAQFINKHVNVFIEIVESNPICQQIYVKGLEDNIDAYAIGGCDLCSIASNKNPITRGVKWITNVFGISEELFTLQQWMNCINNTQLLDILNDSVMSNGNIPVEIMNVQLIKLSRYPNSINNYDFSNNEPKFNIPNFNETLKFVQTYIFQKSSAINSTSRNVVTRKINISSFDPKAETPMINAMNIGDDKLPITLSETGRYLNVPLYEYSASIQTIKLNFVNPPGHRLLELNLCNSRVDKNQTVLLFTTTLMESVFQNAKHDDELFEEIHSTRISGDPTRKLETVHY